MPTIAKALSFSGAFSFSEMSSLRYFPEAYVAEARQVFKLTDDALPSRLEEGTGDGENGNAAGRPINRGDEENNPANGNTSPPSGWDDEGGGETEFQITNKGRRLKKPLSTRTYSSWKDLQEDIYLLARNHGWKPYNAESSSNKKMWVCYRGAAKFVAKRKKQLQPPTSQQDGQSTNVTFEGPPCPFMIRAHKRKDDQIHLTTVELAHNHFFNQAGPGASIRDRNRAISTKWVS